MVEFIKMIGAPCGYNDRGYGGCSIFTCCHEAWEDHMRDYHKVNPDGTPFDKKYVWMAKVIDGTIVLLILLGVVLIICGY